MNKNDTFFDLKINNDFIRSELNERESIINYFEGEWFFDPHETWLASFYMGINNITELIEGYITLFIIAENLHSENLLQYIERTKIKAKQEGCQWIYLEVFSATDDTLELLQTNNWDLVSYNVKKRVEPSNIKVQNSDIGIRYANVSDEYNVKESLVEAYMMGLHSKMAPYVSKKVMVKNIKRYYSPLLSQDRLILIAEFGSQFCGHATYDLHRDKATAQLVDIFVKEPFQNMGVSRSLSAYGEKECQRLGIKVIKGDVDGFSSGKYVLSHLLNVGWNVYSIVLDYNLVQEVTINGDSSISQDHI